MSNTPSKPAVATEAISSALSILRGEIPLTGEFGAKKPSLERIARVRRYADLNPPELTLEALADAFPGVENPLEEAFSETLLEIIDEGSSETIPFRNPLYRHEIRMAQRRVLERLISMASPLEHSPIDETRTAAGPSTGSGVQDLATNIFRNLAHRWWPSTGAPSSLMLDCQRYSEAYESSIGAAWSAFDRAFSEAVEWETKEGETLAKPEILLNRAVKYLEADGILPHRPIAESEEHHVDVGAP